MSSKAPITQGKQYGFFFDQSRCIGCAGCVLACIGTKQMTMNNDVKLLHLFQWESGTFPNVRLNRVFAPCYHCLNPTCVDAGNGALIKEPDYGAVLIDPSKATSSDLKAAWSACPYGAISFDSAAPDSTAYKCDMCIDRLMVGQFPSCVLACPTRALDFGPLDQMTSKWGTNQQLSGMPDPKTTQPAVVFKKSADKKSLVPYDANTAIQLLANRGGSLPPFFSSPADVTQVASGTVSRSSLKMKASGKELVLRTTDDSK